jgi:hypothetical protein
MFRGAPSRLVHRLEFRHRAPGKALRSQQTIKLHDVAFVPSFFTSVVSLQKLIKGGTAWLIKQNKLLLGN